MKNCHKCQIFKKLEEFYKDKSKNDGYQSICIKCRKKYKEIHYAHNKEKILATNNNYREHNKTKVAKIVKKYQEHNRVKIAKYNKNRYRENKDQIIMRAREWAKNNPDKKSIYQSNKKSQLIRATPLWYERELVKTLYLKRDELNKKWGAHFVVDHIIPVKPRNNSVCGLHCWANLQLLDNSLNSAKNDKYEKDW